MHWRRVTDTFYELESRGNVEACIKLACGRWHIFLDASDMVSIQHVGCVEETKQAQKLAKAKLTAWRNRKKVAS